MDEQQVKTLNIIQESIRLAAALVEYSKISKNADLANNINKAIDSFIKNIQKNDPKSSDKFVKGVNDIYKKTPKDQKLEELYKNKVVQPKLNQQYKESKKNLNTILKKYGFKKSFKDYINIKKPILPRFIGSTKKQTEQVQTLQKHMIDVQKTVASMIQKLDNDVKDLKSKVNDSKVEKKVEEVIERKIQEKKEKTKDNKKIPDKNKTADIQKNKTIINNVQKRGRG